jgi:hypothetical protein
VKAQYDPSSFCHGGRFKGWNHFQAMDAIVVITQKKRPNAMIDEKTLRG